MSKWAGVDEGLARAVLDQSEACLKTYGVEPKRVEEDAKIEISTAQGGYGRKQLYELIQNGADALLGTEGRIHVVLTRECLYVANEGAPIAESGLTSLMGTHLSRKRGEEIGRFGLGFKSVVAISDRPQLFSRSGSFGFDRERARLRVQEIVPEGPYPMLRLAEPLDPHRMAEEDAVLRELMDWASTVARIPLVTGYDDLAEDITGFPAEFVLFSPHASQLTLEDRHARVARTVRVSDAGKGVLVLDDDGRESTWRVASQKHMPSREALEDAGELAHRESITVWWAVPYQGRAAVGQFWAFFPTEDKTTLSGIVNAPWKMGEDRRNLLPGRFNHEILAEVLPDLMARVWHELVDPEDPASVLDVLPARGRESRSWADDVLNDPTFRKLAGVSSLPDVDGEWSSPGKSRLHPRGLDEELLGLWRSLEPRPEGWANHGIDKSPERRLKAERLVGDSEWNRPTASEWIEALTGTPSVASSAVAVALVAAVVRQSKEYAADALRAKVLLLEDGSITAPVPGQVFVRSSPEDEGFRFIHPDLAALPAVIGCLERLGIQVLDRAGELRNVLSGKRPGEIEWNRAWNLARQCTPAVALRVFREEFGDALDVSVRVRNRAGGFVPVGAALLPGGVVGPQDSENAKFCIDTAFHREELELLSDLGCVAQPTLRSDSPEETWLRSYKDLILDTFIEKSTRAKPQVDRLQIVGGTVPWPLEPLQLLSPDARVDMTAIALGQTYGDPWRVRHLTNASYGELKYLNPVYWWILKHGRVATAFGAMPLTHTLRPDDDHPDDVLPVADVEERVAEALNLPTEPAQLPAEAWNHMITRAGSWEDLRRCFRVYAWAAHFADPPLTMRAQVGKRSAMFPPSEVAVVINEETFVSLCEQQIPAILVEEEIDSARLQEVWGLEDGTRLLEQELVFHPLGEPEALLDRFPAMRLHLSSEMFDVEIQVCDAIDLVTATRDGMKSRPITRAFENNQVLVTVTDDAQVLRAVADVLQLPVDATDIRRILDHIQEQATQELVADLRNADSDDERMSLLVGEEGLRRSLPAAALSGIEETLRRRLDAVEMAGLVRAVHGVSALQHFRGLLEEKGLNPPRQWAGTSAARRFVTDLGFAPELAGFSVDARPAVLTIDGPADLSPLHDYQEVVTGRIKDMLRGQGPGRGMVSLPTGAGKTRVAVQALVEEIREDALRGPIVWIAQSDELCEQAVETWSYIWRAIGPRSRMTVSRLWGSNEVTEVTDGFQLVVATPDKLNTKVGSVSYEWLTNPTVVIVDEAHTSVAPSYTRVLEWMGRGRSRRDRRPLVGLTATPFRNTNIEETKRLALRYDENRLDDGAFADDPYAELQERGVLARVNHRLLQGADVQFSTAEAQQIETMRFIPKSVESKLGENLSRNQRIVDSVAELPLDWTALLFATSVENSRVLAAQLTHRGIPSVAISGDTDSAARRHYIEEFKQGRIRVITNYNVLTQGFDAPAVRAVYVTRPTFSANVYQQMIGRGLRGPLNGGSEEVLIVNVEDNFHQYGDRLAFFEFEYLWKPDA